MYLVDSSVLIAYLREISNPATVYLSQILTRNLPFGITSHIFQEILQGSASSRDFKQLSIYLSTQRFYHPLDPLLSYQSAAEIYFKCRNKGIIIRSTIDCIIAQIAIEHDVLLLHDDRDFKYIQQIAPQLKLVEFN